MKEKKENKNYISLQEATQLCNYSQEYLSLRARQGKLKAEKFGRNWVTTKDWLNEYLNQHFVKKENKNYISLQEATQLCNYSQEYLSLRARQGKLKAEKFGRNWVTTKDWLNEYLTRVESYNEKVREEKVNAKVEKTDVGLAKEKKQVFREPAKVPANLPFGEIILRPPVQKNILEKMADNLTEIRPALASLLMLFLIIGCGILGKEDFKIPLKNPIYKTQASLQELSLDISKSVGIAGQAGSRMLDDVGSREVSVGGERFTLRNAFDENINSFRGYWYWLAQKLGPLVDSYCRADEFMKGKLLALKERIERDVNKANYLVKRGFWRFGDFIAERIAKKIALSGRDIYNNYWAADDYLRLKLTSIPVSFLQYLRDAREGYLALNDSFEKQLSSDWKSLKKIVSYPFYAVKNLALWPFAPSESSLTKEDLQEESKTLMEQIREEFRNLRQEGIPTKQVTEKIIEKETVKEVETVKKIVETDDEQLEKIRENIRYLEDEIAKRLYAPGGVIRQTIHVTEPVRSPKIYQEDGEIVLQTAGSGNIIISSATGLQLHGKQVIIDSNSATNPLIVLNDNTRINGDLTVTGKTNIGGKISGETLILNAPDSYSGDLLQASHDGDLKFSVNQEGDVLLAGDLTVEGDFTVSGSQNYSGAATFIASSTSPALKVVQNGTGNIVQFMNGGNNVFSLSSDGYATLTTSPSADNPAFLFQTSDVNNWATGTATFLGINASSTFSGNFIDFQKNGTSLFAITSDGTLTLNATMTASTFVSGAGDSTVRKSGEEVLREILPISRYDIPAQTNTTTYFRISKHFAANPLSSTPQPLPGAVRVYKLIIKYADDISTASSTASSTVWRIYRPGAGTVSDKFSLLGQDMGSFAEGIATTTENLIIPDTDWQVELKLPASGKSIRVFQLFLAAFDKIN